MKAKYCPCFAENRLGLFISFGQDNGKITCGQNNRKDSGSLSAGPSTVAPEPPSVPSGAFVVGGFCIASGALPLVPDVSPLHATTCLLPRNTLKPAAAHPLAAGAWVLPAHAALSHQRSGAHVLTPSSRHIMTRRCTGAARRTEPAVLQKAPSASRSHHSRCRPREAFSVRHPIANGAGRPTLLARPPPTPAFPTRCRPLQRRRSVRRPITAAARRASHSLAYLRAPPA